MHSSPCIWSASIEERKQGYDEDERVNEMIGYDRTVEDEGRSAGLLIERPNLATLYTPRDGFVARAAPERTSSPAPPSDRGAYGKTGPGMPRENRKIWGSKRASRAYNLPPIPARMSARSRTKLVETYPCGPGKPPVESRRRGREW